MHLRNSIIVGTARIIQQSGTPVISYFPKLLFMDPIQAAFSSCSSDAPRLLPMTMSNAAHDTRQSV